MHQSQLYSSIFLHCPKNHSFILFPLHSSLLYFKSPHVVIIFRYLGILLCNVFVMYVLLAQKERPVSILNLILREAIFWLIPLCFLLRAESHFFLLEIFIQQIHLKMVLILSGRKMLQSSPNPQQELLQTTAGSPASFWFVCSLIRHKSFFLVWIDVRKDYYFEGFFLFR